MPRIIEISTISSPNKSGSPSSSSSSYASSSSGPSSPYNINLPPYVPSPERSPPHRRYPTPTSTPSPVSPPRSPILRYQHHTDMGDSPVHDFDTWSAPVGKMADLDYGDDSAYVDLETPRDLSVVAMTSEHMSVGGDDVSGTTMSASMINKSRRTYDKNISIETNFPELLGTMKRLQDEVHLFGLRKMQIKAFAQQELILLQRETLKIEKVDPELLERLYLPPPTGRALEEMRLDIRNIDDNLDDIAKDHLMLIDDSFEHQPTEETEQQLQVLDEKRRDLFDRLVPRHQWPRPSRIPRWVGKKAGQPGAKAAPVANRGARGAVGRQPVAARGPTRTARAVGQPPPRPVASRTTQGGRNVAPPRPTTSRTAQGGRNVPPPRPTTSRTTQGGRNVPPPRPTTSRTSRRATGAPSRGALQPARPSKLPTYQHRPGSKERPPKEYPRPLLSLAHRLQRMEMWIDFHQKEDVSGLTEPDESLFNSLWQR